MGAERIATGEGWAVNRRDDGVQLYVKELGVFQMSPAMAQRIAAALLVAATVERAGEHLETAREAIDLGRTAHQMGKAAMRLAKKLGVR